MNTKIEPQVERRLRLLAVTSVIPWEVDAQTWQFTYIGPQAEVLLGYPPEQWYENDFWPSHIHAEDRDYAVNFCKTSSNTLTDYEFEYRMIAADGRVVWLNDVVNVVTENGTPLRLQGFMKDITDRKRAEEALRGAQQQLETQVEGRTKELRLTESRLNDRDLRLPRQLSTLPVLIGQSSSAESTATTWLQTLRLSFKL